MGEGEAAAPFQQHVAALHKLIGPQIRFAPLRARIAVHVGGHFGGNGFVQANRCFGDVVAVGLKNGVANQIVGVNDVADEVSRVVVKQRVIQRCGAAGGVDTHAVIAQDGVGQRQGALPGQIEANAIAPAIVSNSAVLQGGSRAIEIRAAAVIVGLVGNQDDILQRRAALATKEAAAVQTGPVPDEDRCLQRGVPFVQIKSAAIQGAVLRNHIGANRRAAFEQVQAAAIGLRRDISGEGVCVQNSQRALFQIQASPAAVLGGVGRHAVGGQIGLARFEHIQTTAAADSGIAVNPVLLQAYLTLIQMQAAAIGGAGIGSEGVFHKGSVAQLSVNAAAAAAEYGVAQHFIVGHIGVAKFHIQPAAVIGGRIQSDGVAVELGKAERNQTQAAAVTAGDIGFDDVVTQTGGAFVKVQAAAVIGAVAADCVAHKRAAAAKKRRAAAVIGSGIAKDAVIRERGVVAAIEEHAAAIIGLILAEGVPVQCRLAVKKVRAAPSVISNVGSDSIANETDNAAFQIRAAPVAGDGVGADDAGFELAAFGGQQIRAAALRRRIAEEGDAEQIRLPAFHHQPAAAIIGLIIPDDAPLQRRLFGLAQVDAAAVGGLIIVNGAANDGGCTAGDKDAAPQSPGVVIVNEAVDHLAGAIIKINRPAVANGLIAVYPDLADGGGGAQHVNCAATLRLPAGQMQSGDSWFYVAGDGEDAVAAVHLDGSGEQRRERDFPFIAVAVAIGGAISQRNVAALNGEALVH